MRRFFMVGIFLVKKCRDKRISEMEFAWELGVDRETWNRVRVGEMPLSHDQVRSAIDLLGMSEAEWRVEMSHFENVLERQGYLTHRSPAGQVLVCTGVEDVARAVELVLNQGAKIVQEIARVVKKHPIPFVIAGGFLLGVAVAELTKK